MTEATGALTGGGRGGGSERLRLLLLANPHASTTDDVVQRRVTAALGSRHAVEAVQTGYKGHAIELGRAAAAAGFDAVVVLGGDGTINEVANGLVGTRTALAPLPGGATNVYCRMLGLPTDLAAACALLAGPERHVVRVDVGRVNDRWFTFAAGVGLDASAVERVDRHPRSKARWGKWFFASMGLKVFLGDYVAKPVRMEVETAGTRHEAVTVLMQNGDVYTYFGKRPIVLLTDGGLSSGDLGGVALRRASVRDLAPVLWRALSGRLPVTGHPAVQALETGDGLVVRSRDERLLPIQVDGDNIGRHPEARFAVSPGALRILVGGTQPPPGVTR